MAAQHEHPEAPRVRRVASDSASPTAARRAGGFDPFERVFTPQGTIDREYASKRLPVLVEMLRRHPAFFPVRVDVEELGRLLVGGDAAPVRDAANEEAFEAALRAFSEAHLHELAPPDLQSTLQGVLSGIARDEAVSRRDRAGAAVGIALLSAPPDAHGLRGRGLFDLVLRVTMEEQTAQEQIRRKARESREAGEAGLTPAELETFWQQYPQLRWRHEERYRREVTNVLQRIEKDELPPAVSVDLGLRGAALLLAEIARVRTQGGRVESNRAEEILRAPFVSDLLEEGGPLVVERWLAEAAHAAAMPSNEKRAFVRTLETAARLVAEGGPGSDPILFYLYLRAVVQGHYYVRDEAELAAAKEIFAPDGLAAPAVLGYARHLGDRGDAAAQRRVILAALELWPQDENVRAAATAFGNLEMERAGGERMGPLYADVPEEDDAETTGDAAAETDDAAGDAEDSPAQ